jgi:putative aldouronate transport system permease protein
MASHPNGTALSSEVRSLTLMIAIPMAFVAVFAFAPLGGLLMAFQDFHADGGLLHSPWVGLDNFRRLFAGGDFLQVLRNTVTISLLRLSFGFAAPIVLALLLNEVRLTGLRRGIQTLTSLPHFLSWVILGGVFLMMFGQQGPVNQLLQVFGLSAVDFMGNDYWFIVMLIGTGIWQAAGYGAIIYLAALSGISPSLYEAATVDGANRWRQVRHITLPGLVPSIVTLFILSLSGILNAGFDQIYNMYNPMVYDTADILDTYVLRRMQGLDFSLATAAGMFKSVIGLLLVLSANWVARRASQGERGLF